MSPRLTPTPFLLVALAGLALPVGALGASPVPSLAGDMPQLIDARTVTVDGARLISMSPDGRSIAAARPAIGFARGQLCVIDIETLVDRACADLSGLGAGLRVEDVTWSPDSTHLAFAERAFVTLEDGDLWVMDAATGALTNVDDDGFEGDVPLFDAEGDAPAVTLPVSPAFSPDGSTLAFSRTVFEDGARRNALATVPVAGGPVTELRTMSELPGALYFGIGWASDGETLYISFQAPDRDDLGNGVWTVAADGSAARLLVGRYQDSHGPAVLDVSSDGGWLLLQDPEVFGAFQEKLPAYAVADSTSGTPVPLLPIETADTLGSYVAWAGLSPDGQWLLTLERTAADGFHVGVRSLDGTVSAPLLPEPLEMAGPVDRGIALTWSANGTAFLTGAGDLGTGYLLTIAGGTTE